MPLPDESLLVVGLLHGDDADSGSNRQTELIRASLEIVNQLIPPQKAVGLRAVIRKPGQDAHEVRGIQLERIPALGQPGFTDPTLLENDVLATIPLQKVTGSQAGLAAPDNHAIDRRHVIPFAEAGRSCSMFSIIPPR